MLRRLTMRQIEDWAAWYRLSPLAAAGGLIRLGLGGGPPAAPRQTIQEAKAQFALAQAAFAKRAKRTK